MADPQRPTGWEGSWDGPHLTEDTAHAWIDGALTAESAERAVTHVAGCADCDALVAEARGLVAVSSRVLAALDEVPGAVLPAPVVPVAFPGPARRWWAGAPARAAAAVLVLAVGSAAVLRTRGVPARDAAAHEEALSPVDAAPQVGASAPPVADSAATPGAAAPEARPVRLAEPVPAPVAAALEAPAAAARKAVADAAPIVSGAPVAQAVPVPAPAAPRPPAAPPVAERVAGEARADSLPVARRRERLDLAASALRAVEPAGSGTIVGQVTTRDGRPVAAAWVEVVGSTRGTLTDDSGRFVLPELPVGHVGLTVRRIGFEAHRASVVVGAADTASATLLLRPATVALSQVEVTGAAAAGAARSAPLAAPGCWAVRPGAGWARSGAPALPTRLRLATPAAGARGGDSGPAEGDGGAWTGGSWEERDGGRIAVELPAPAGGRALLLLQREPPGWRGEARWTPTGSVARGGGEVRLVPDRCPAP